MVIFVHFTTIYTTIPYSELQSDYKNHSHQFCFIKNNDHLRYEYLVLCSERNTLIIAKRNLKLTLSRCPSGVRHQSINHTNAQVVDCQHNLLYFCMCFFNKCLHSYVYQLCSTSRQIYVIIRMKHISYMWF